MALEFGFPRRGYAEFYLKGDWHNLIQDIRQDPGFRIERGRKSEQSKPTPSECSFQMDDGPDHGNGDYNPKNPMGQWWPDFKRNAPFRFGFELAEDNFNRTSTEGWNGDWVNGRAIGGTIANSDWSVNGTVAQHTVPVDNAERGSVYQPENFSVKNVEMRFTFTRPNLDVLGGPYTVVCQFRIIDSNNFVYSYVSIGTTEIISVGVSEMLNGTGSDLEGGAGVSVSAAGVGQSTEVRTQIDGNTVRVKAWPTGTPEPLKWQSTGTGATIIEPGPVGVVSFVDDFNTNTDPHVFSYENFSLRIPRFSGETSVVQPGMDLSEKIKVTNIECGTLFRRKEQGTTPTQSTLRQFISSNAEAFDLFGYWPCEDDKFSSQFASGLKGGSPLLIYGAASNVSGGAGDGTNTLEFAAEEKFACTAPLPHTNLSTSQIYLTDFTETGRFDFRFFMHIPSSGNTGNINVYVLTLFFRGSANRWEIGLDSTPEGSIGVYAYDRTGQIIADFNNAVIFDKPALWYVQLVQNGSNVDYTVTYLPVGASASISYTSGSAVGYTLGRLFSITQTSGFQGQDWSPDNLASGHFMIGNTNVPSTNFVDPLNAFIGESCLDRIARLAEENNLGTIAQMDPVISSPTMGPQLINTPLSLIIECANTDHGFFFDSRGDNTFSYIPLGNLYDRVNNPTTILDHDDFHLAEGFIPLEDDSGTVNDITVKAVRGSSIQLEQETGPMNVQDSGTVSGAVGRYDKQFTVNPETFDQLTDSAGWLLHLGTTEEPRFPEINVDLAAPTVENDSILGLSIMDVDIGDVIAIDNLQEWHVYDRVLQFCLGYTEILEDENGRHTISFNTSPARPYIVGRLSDGEIRLDSSDSTLSSGIDSTDTTFDVTTPEEETRWVTEADEIPSGSAVGQGTSVTPNYLIATDSDAEDVNIGDHGYLYDGVGTLHEATQFTVTGKNSAFGFTNIEFSPDAAANTVAGDVMRFHYASNFPFDIKIGGERMTVTDINLTTDPQEFVVTRSVNGVVKSHSAGAQVQLAEPYYLAK